MHENRNLFHFLIEINNMHRTRHILPIPRTCICRRCGRCGVSSHRNNYMIWYHKFLGYNSCCCDSCYSNNRCSDKVELTVGEVGSFHDFWAGRVIWSASDVLELL